MNNAQINEFSVPSNINIPVWQCKQINYDMSNDCDDHIISCLGTPVLT